MTGAHGSILIFPSLLFIVNSPDYVCIVVKIELSVHWVLQIQNRKNVTDCMAYRLVEIMYSCQKLVLMLVEVNIVSLTDSGITLEATLHVCL